MAPPIGALFRLLFLQRFICLSIQYETDNRR